jgi:uncharacterized protein
MVPFFLAVLVVYGAFHAYAFWKIEGALSLAPSSQLRLIVFLTLMLLAPFLVRAAERYGFPFLTRVFAYAGYTWMGIVFLFVCASLFFDFCRLLFFASGLVAHRNFTDLLPSHGQTFAISLFLSLGIAVYGWFEARDIRTENVTIRSSRIPAVPGKIRIVQITDVHLGVMVGKERLEKMAALVRDAAPDILVSTGDLVDGQGDDVAPYLEAFRSIEPRYGKFAVTGNHEFYAGLDRSLSLTRSAGFEVLRGQGLTVGGLINIAGVDDPVSRDPATYREGQEESLLSGLSPGHFTVFLKHRPVASRETEDTFDLQLSGHTHKGQIFPFNFVTHLFFPKQGGFFCLSKRSFLYASRGTGTWGPPMRFLAPPEVTVIDLVHAEGNQ